MEKQTILVSAIKDTKNENVKQLELRVQITKSAEANPVAFFLQGLQNVSPTVEQRVAYQSVSTEFIEKFGITLGCNLAEKTGLANLRLVIKESLFPRTWKNPDGSVGQSQPKINPQTKQVLTVNGQPIYRNTFISMDGKTIVVDANNPPKGITLDASDEYVQHTLATADNSSSISAMKAASEAARSGSVVAEPQLPE